MSAWSDFIARLREAAPARRNETEAYEKFNYHYTWSVTINTVVTSQYTIAEIA